MTDSFQYRMTMVRPTRTEEKVPALLHSCTVAAISWSPNSLEIAPGLTYLHDVKGIFVYLFIYFFLFSFNFISWRLITL